MKMDICGICNVSNGIYCFIFREKQKKIDVFDFEPFPMSEIGGIGVKFHNRMLPRSKFQHLERVETPSPDLTRTDLRPVLHRKDKTVVTLHTAEAENETRETYNFANTKACNP